ncbi:hypothetical protein [Pectobacterium polaris]|uniref:hypothetical protein n=1 Tax=Pectobacterium polaris TaxID=2042057 RepID=UPI00202D6FD5|nr:hypothetical protein [Pectobacterium polaris]MCL6325000.1 hypothetical protein [Pectobacterium polaris]
MNIQSFINHYGNIDIAPAMIAIARSEDDLGVVLRVHLLCEKFLEAWICGITGYDNLFVEAPQSGDFNMEFFQKLKMCQLTGLPDNAYRAMKKINDVRNSFAHRISTRSIQNGDIDSISHHVGTLSNSYLSFPLSEYEARIRNENTDDWAVYSLVSVDTPNRIKLMCLHGALSQCLFIHLGMLPLSPQEG